jgi:Fe-S oxidoreductase
MWMEEQRGSPINEERVREAAETGAETIAVACPYCTVMLDDGVATTGRELRVADVAVLMAEAIEQDPPGARQGLIRRPHAGVRAARRG